jgi:DNA mismatch repair protein MutH
MSSLRPTIEEVSQKLLELIGTPQTCPKTKNKGGAGHLLENFLGIPRSSACLDCSDGEVKAFPLKRLKNGSLVPKETVAITMLSTNALTKEEFQDSKCFMKMKHMLMVPYLREKDTVTFFKPTIIELKDELLATIKADYDQIRSEYLSTGTLKSATGKYLQNRTKGPGGDKKTRAFYLRTHFMKTYVTI